MLKINCKSQKNLGKGSCPFTPGLSTMGILAPVTNATVTLANMADKTTFLAFLNAQLHHDDPLKRWQILGPYRGMEDMSEDITTFTDEYGDKEVTDDVRYMHAFRLKNGMSYHKFLRTYNKQHEKYVYFDFTGGVMHGAVHPDLDANGLEQMTGLDMNLLFAPAPKKADRSNPTFYKVLIGLADTVQVVDEAFSVDTEINPLRALKGVQEVVLTDITAQVVAGGATVAAGTYHITATTEDGKTNLASGTLGSLLAHVDGWIFRDKKTMVEITITTMTRNADNTAFIANLDEADTDYDDAAGGKALGDLEPVADLATLGAKYFANSVPLELITDAT